MKVLLEAAEKRDLSDALSSFSKLFVTGNYPIYLDGNSLGKLPHQSKKIINEVVETQWGEQLINSWNQHWLEVPKRIARQLETLLGAPEQSVYVGESTSVNLYKLVLGLLLSNQYYKNLSSDILNFPSDLYILEGLANQHGANYHLLSYPDEKNAQIDKLKAHIAEHPGIVCLSMVTFKSAYYYPVTDLNEWAKKHHSIIVWDMSHAVGICDVDCEEMGILAAVGCTYKYLNGGPGAPAFLMLSKAVGEKIQNPMQGWFGHEKPFEFNYTYQGSIDINRFGNGTPPVLSLCALEPGIAITLQAGIKTIAKKNKDQIKFFGEAVTSYLTPLGFSLYSPHSLERTGGHISISHPEAKSIVEVLKMGNENFPAVMPDFRPPNLIRLGVASLYISYSDIAMTIAFLKEIAKSKSYRNVNAKNRIVP